MWTVGAGILVVAVAAGIVYRTGGQSRLFGGSGGRLNVLLITVDTTRADHLGCYGRPAAQTPNMDRLAEEGALFRRCSTGAVMTLPSHCTIMTGLYPFVHGVRRNGTDHLPAAATTLAELFKAVGVATGASVGSYVLDPRFGLAQGFDAYRGVPRPRTGSVEITDAQRKGDVVCNDALELLRERARQRFFLWVHFYDPHYPYESPRHPDVQSAEAYADEIAFMDVQVGRLLDELRKLGLEQNTLILLVGDHGEGLEDHLENQHGYFAYETCQRVPLLVRCPGVVPAGLQIDAVVRTVDIAPTILELAGQPPLQAVSGVSLLPLLVDRSADLELRAYAETPEAYTLFRLSTIRTLTADHWKYIWSTSPQLFDLASDPGELHNAIAEQPDMAASLHNQLRALLAEAPPRIPEEPSAALTRDEIARLESLGYTGMVPDEPNAPDPSGLDTFEPRGGDPHAYAEVIRAYEHARDANGHGHFAQAESELRSILTALPDAPAPLCDLAYALSRQGHLDEASRTYERALALTPADSRTRSEYAFMLTESAFKLMDRQQWEQAIVQAGQALRLSPDGFSAHLALGLAYNKLGRLDEACVHLEVATRLEPQTVSATYALGTVYLQQERFAEAAACFRKVLALEPSSEPARAALQAAEYGLRR